MKSHDYVVFSPAPFYPYSGEMNPTKPGLSLLRAMRTENFQTNKNDCKRHCSAWTFSKLIFKTHAKNGQKNNADSLFSIETAARMREVCLCPRRAGAVICLTSGFSLPFPRQTRRSRATRTEKSPSPSVLLGLCTRKVRKLASSRKLQQRCSKQRGTQKLKEWYLKKYSIWRMNLIKYNPLPPHRVTVMPNAKLSTASVQKRSALPYADYGHTLHKASEQIFFSYKLTVFSQNISSCQLLRAQMKIKNKERDPRRETGGKNGRKER